MAEYEVIATEYYDSSAHPTCENLGRLSRLWIRDSFHAAVDPELILEVGTGDSVIAPLLYERGMPIRGIELQDRSEKMLVHSARWEEHGAKLMVGDACALERPVGSVGILIASLGDPYNVVDFWRGVRRVLRSDGQVIFTMPSFEWAVRFRNISNPLFAHRAEFILRDRSVVDVPSYIYPLADQVRLIESVDLMVIQFGALGTEMLGDKGPLSSKLDVFNRGPSSILWGFRAVISSSPLNLGQREAWPKLPL